MHLYSNIYVHVHLGHKTLFTELFRKDFSYSSEKIVLRNEEKTLQNSSVNKYS